MSIDECIRLHNKSSESYEISNGDGTWGGVGLKTLPVETILENRRIAEANLRDKSKEELIQFIESHWFNDDLYPVLR